MKAFSELIAFFIIVTTWLAGIVLAVGGMTWVAVFVPFYAWYLVVERAMRVAGAL